MNDKPERRILTVSRKPDVAADASTQDSSRTRRTSGERRKAPPTDRAPSARPTSHPVARTQSAGVERSTNVQSVSRPRMRPATDRESLSLEVAVHVRAMETLGALGQALRLAAAVISRVRAGEALSDILPAFWAHFPLLTPHVRGKAQDLIYGTLRDYGRSDAILGELVPQGVKSEFVRGLLDVAIHVLESGSETEHATVDQAVIVAKADGDGRFGGFVNGVLRNYLRSKPEFDRHLTIEEVTNLRLPRWWIVRLRRIYPSNWMDIFAAYNSHPPMTLRINRRKVRRSVYLDLLNQAGIAAEKVGRDGLRLLEPIPVSRLPGFNEGQVSVQDAGAQLAEHWLGAGNGQRVLDACAAPGGKTCHILEYRHCQLTALDVSPVRAQRIEDNLARLGLKADVRVGDCRQPAVWWDGQPFDRILADVPCTASGVVRRQPDIKWHRQPEDIQRFADTQSVILDSLWSMLAPGGRLLYVTCSIFPEENSLQISRFVTRTPDVRRVAIDGKLEQQLLPSAEHDGFFYALLEKKAD